MQTIVQEEEKPLGVIDSLQKGFELLNLHLWLLLIPILLDVILWLGPRLSLAPITNRFVQAFSNQSDLPEQFAANFDLAIENLNTLGRDYNLLALLTGPLTRLPSLQARLDFHSVDILHKPVITLAQWQTAALWVIILVPTGILIGSLWLTLIAFALKRERLGMSAFLSRWGWIWLNTNLYLLALIAGSALFALVFSVTGAFVLLLFGAAGAVILGILWVLFIGFSIWLWIGLYFVVYAIALDGVNVASAIWRSLNVVGRNAMSTLGFLILSMLLTEGFTRIWMRIGGYAWGVLLGALGNAYLGTAIVVAAFLFYQSRYYHWQKTRLIILGQRSEQNESS